MSAEILVVRCGLVPYEEAWELQRSIAAAVSEGEQPDTILLLEHPPTSTTGLSRESALLRYDPRVDFLYIPTPPAPAPPRRPGC